MNNSRLFVLAFNKREWNTVAFIIIGYYAGYVEGDIESDRIKFNKYFKLLPVKALKCMQEQLVDIRFNLLDQMIEKRIEDAPINCSMTITI